MQIKVRTIWVYDIETISNFFCVVFKNIDNNAIKTFIISDWQNDIDSLISFVKTHVTKGVGFNSLRFDYPVIHNILLKKVTTAEAIYKLAQRVITGTYILPYTEKRLFKQVDLFLIWHYNNKNKSCSLKKLQINMDYPNVKDMPIKHWHKVKSKEEGDMVVSYCINDVNSTNMFLQKSVSKIKERQLIEKETGLKCQNMSDTSIGEQLVLKYYCETYKLDPKEVKERRTEVDSVKLSDIVLDKVFYTDPFNKTFLNGVLNSTIYAGGDFHYAVNIDNMVIDIKKGGMHGARRGNYKSDDVWIIVDSDIAGLYPRLFTYYNFRPAHLPGFNKVVEPIYDKRIDAKKLSKDKSLKPDMQAYYAMQQGMLKLALNSVYGKFNDIYSFLFDYSATLKTTINGQLLGVKWLESLVKIVPEIRILQANTDGSTFMIKREYLDLFYEVCDTFQDYSGFVLEHVVYQKMSIRDVNSYCALDINGKLKVKGEYVYEIGEDFHKKFNYRISRKAAVDFLMYDKPIRESIYSCKNLYWFCGSERFKNRESEGFWLDNNLNETPTQENVRFYASKGGLSLRKRYVNGKSKGSVEKVEVGQTLTEANYIETNELPKNIDYLFYERYARQLCNAVVINKKDKSKGTLNLFD